MARFEPDDLADAPTLLAAIERELPGLVVTEAYGDYYVFYDPDGITEPDKRFPFSTLMTGDRYDAASNLDRDTATYRVNLGVSKAEYEDLLGPAPRTAVGRDVIDTGADYTATDTVLPHPYYAPMHWLCVVNPRESTREHLARLFTEAHAEADRRYRKA